MGGRQGGKKIRYTPDLAAEIEGNILAGLTDHDAAVAAGISWDTFNRWMKGYRGIPEDFPMRMHKARAMRARMWLGVIRRAAVGHPGDKSKGIAPQSPDWRAAGDLLDRCQPQYRKGPALEVNTVIGTVQNVSIEDDSYDYSKLSLEEQFAFDQLLAKLRDPEVVPVPVSAAPLLGEGGVEDDEEITAVEYARLEIGHPNGHGPRT